MTHVEIVGDKVFYKSIERMSFKIRIKANDEMVKMGTEIRNNIKLSMQNTKKRTTKPVKRGAKFHFPSIPDNPPAVDSGRLVNDIQMSVTRSGLSNVTVEVGDVSQKYGKILEETENPNLEGHGLSQHMQI